MTSLLKDALFVFLAIEFILIVLEYRREGDWIIAFTKLFKRQYLLPALVAPFAFLLLKPLLKLLFS